MNRILLAASLLLPTTGVSAATNLITFEEPALTAMVNTPGSVVPIAARLKDQFLPTLGVSFSSAGGFAAVVNHAQPTASFPNVIGGTAAAGTLDYAAPITISFFDPANTTAMGVTDFVRIEGDWFPLGSGTVTMSAFSWSGELLGTTTDTDDKVFGVSGPVLALSIAGIHSVIISGTSGTVGFDNLQFNTVSAVAAIPEPTTWALMIAGFGLAGAAARTQSRRAPSTA